ncbi:MAG TPA: PRC-barrel domain-containing protein [Rubricoccaceae bacterium]|jgi:hypothetical protein
MTRVSLTDSGDYGLVNDEQDVRGRTVVDGTGQPLGTVEAMLLDTDAELVTTLVLDTGTEIPVADVTLGEDVVYYTAGGGTEGASAEAIEGTVRSGVTVFDDGGRVVRRERVAETGDVSAYDADFQTHHASTYGAAGRSYDETSGAYRYGYTSAHGDANRNRTYSDAEADLRSGYTGADFDADREAVRYGYGRAQRRAS